jgi:hypothetical protein
MLEGMPALVLKGFGLVLALISSLVLKQFVLMVVEAVGRAIRTRAPTCAFASKVALE